METVDYITESQPRVFIKSIEYYVEDVFSKDDFNDLMKSLLRAREDAENCNRKLRDDLPYDKWNSDPACKLNNAIINRMYDLYRFLTLIQYEYQEKHKDLSMREKLKMKKYLEPFFKYVILYNHYIDKEEFDSCERLMNFISNPSQSKEYINQLYNAAFAGPVDQRTINIKHEIKIIQPTIDGQPVEQKKG